jgi:hypothetical protein
LSVRYGNSHGITVDSVSGMEAAAARKRHPVFFFWNFALDERSRGRMPGG